MRRLLPLLLVVVLTACTAGDVSGGDTTAPADEPSASSTADPAAVRDALAAAFAGDQPGPAAEEEGGCFADRLLEAATVAELEEAGVVDGTGAVAPAFPALERPLAEKVVDAQLACTDFVADSSQAGLYVTKGRLARQAYAACLRQALPDEAVRAAVLAAVMGRWDDPAVSGLSRNQARCARAADR